LSKNTPGRIPSRGPTPGGGYLETCIPRSARARPTRDRAAGNLAPTHRAISHPMLSHRHP